MKYFIQTYGCQMNVADSNAIAAHLLALGMSEAREQATADLVILNTCSVRHQAENRARSFIGRLKPLKKARPGLKIIVVGCMAQREGDHIRRSFPYVDLVIGAKDIDHFAEIFNSYFFDGISLSPAPPVPRSSAVTAFVTIMRGCENFCSYCIVPFVRGPEKSRPAEEIAAEITGLCARGTREITLLGQNVNSYHDNAIDFPALLARLHGIPGLARIRFMTSHPKDLSDGLIDAMRHLPMVCEHLHLPLQSGSDSVLAAMNRSYTSEDYRRVVDKVRRRVPGIALTTDILIGYPGETSADFAATLDLLRAVDFDFLFAFMYSPRPGTAAAQRPDDVPQAVKEQRHAAILTALNGISAQKNATLVGTIQEVLVERMCDGQLEGRTRTNKKVFLPGSEKMTGQLVKVRITASKLNSLTGIPADRPAPDYA